jgi:hypothetical protein
MKLFSRMDCAGAYLKRGALGAILALGMLPVEAQNVFHVGGDGVIGTSVLNTVDEGGQKVAKLFNQGSIWSANGGTGVVYSRLKSPVLTVANSGPVTLTFNHSYFFEPNWDGGALFVSINGGAPAYVPASAFIANGYDGPLSGPSWVSSVFIGQETFTGKSEGYDEYEMTEAVVNLGTLTAGDTVAIEFRGGWDEGYVESGVNWEIESVAIKDSTNAALIDVDFYDGPGGFTVTSDLSPAGSWRYFGESSQFEIDGDTLAADRYAPSTPGATTVIDLNGAELSVILLDGTVDVGDTFTLFDLSGGTTIRGDYYSITLPVGSWDVSKLKTHGTISCKAIGGGLRVSTFDTISGSGNLNPISNLRVTPPSGTGIQTADINYGDFLSLPGLTDLETFTVLWEGWLDVTLDGHGDYTFGTSSDDGSVIYLDLNDDGDFNDPGELVVNNNRDQGDTAATGTVNLTRDSVHILIGYYEVGGGNAMAARFKKGAGQAWGSLTPIGGSSGHFSPTSLAPTKNITSFSVAPYGDAKIVENRITFKVTDGGSVKALTPVIAIDGSSVSPASGVPQDFSQPVTYTVTASDGTTRDFVVRAVVIDLPVSQGLGVWLKADSIQPNDPSQGRVYGPNSYVTRWNDLSGGDLHATQAAHLSQPRYLANDLNGLPTVKWDGTGQFLRGTASTTIKTIFAVCKKDAEGTNFDGLFSQSPSSDTQNIRGNATAWAATGGNPGTNEADFANNGQVRVNGGNTPVHNGQWHILMEESASSPTFTYQLGQTFLNRFLNGRIAELIIYDRSLSEEEADAIGSYLTDKYALTTEYPPLAPQAKMIAFGIPGWQGVVNEPDKTVSLTVPFSTNLATFAPTFTLSGGATSDKSSGSVQNFTNPVTYTIKSSDNLVTAVYTVTVNKSAVRTDKELLAFGPEAVIDGTNVLWAVPYGSNTASLNPLVVVSPLATVSPAPGTPQNFTNPVLYTVTAEDGSSQVYTVTAVVGPPPPTTRRPALWLDASQVIGLSADDVVNRWSDTSGIPNHANRSQGSPRYKPDTLNGKAVIQFGSDNPSFTFNRISNIRSVFWVLKENFGASKPRFLLGDQGSYDFHRADASNGPLWSNDYASPSIKTGVTKMMGEVINGITTPLPADSFQLISLVTTGNVRANTVSHDRTQGDPRSWNGEIAEILIYDAPLSNAEEVEIGAYLAQKYGLATSYPAVAPLANLYSLSFPGRDLSVDQATKSITVSVPYGTDVTTLAPTLVLSGGATSDKASGSPQNFTNPVTYRITSADSAITNDYTVNVIAASQPPSATAPVLWLDASKITGLSDGQQVDLWRDSSGVDNHASRSDGSPVFKTSVINGKPVVRFDSGAFHFNRISTIRSVFWVLKENANASQPRFLLGDTGSYHFHRSDAGNNGPPWHGAHSNPNILNGVTKLMGTTINGVSTPLPSESFQLLSLVTTGNVQAESLSNDRNIPNRSWSGDIAEVLIYDKPLSDAEEKQVGAYLANKYGLSTAYSASPYGTWAAQYPTFDLSDPAGDADKDGVTNWEEYAFGLNPTLGSSVNPISVPFQKATGTFTYTRANPALSGLQYKVWTSTNLNDWIWDQAAVQQVVGSVGDVQTVQVTLSAVPAGPTLFVRVSTP